MASVRELRNRLRRPLRQELLGGCRDEVVVGGLEKLVTTVGAPFADLRELVAGYRLLEPAARAERLRQALSLLDAKEEGDGPPGRGPDSAGSSAAGERDAGRTGAAISGAALLDATIGDEEIGLGAQAARKLAEFGALTHRDLVFAWPHRYEDRRALPDFSALAGREQATAIGTLTGRKQVRSRGGLTVLRGFLEDARGGRLTVVWFNQPWLERQLFPGRRLVVTGRVKAKGRNLELHATHFEAVEEGESLSTDRIVGAYRTPRGTSQAYVRRALDTVLKALGTVPDHLPRTLLEREGLIPLDRALRNVHFPEDEAGLESALRRLKFDEYLFLELRMLRTRATGEGGVRSPARLEDLQRFEASLPFGFTAAQRRALNEILTDMAGPRQMARLLQGDVGSGKTAVAAAAAWIALRNGHQAALMAPTEVLARQHFLNLREYLYPLNVRSELLIGSSGTGERREARARIASGEADLVVGTHALIQDGVRFRSLGLAVIDEEHRFGVEQRRALIREGPDVLVMSATPIPRSLALTVYGDLDLSVIDEMPPGRTPVATELVNAGRRRDVYRGVWNEVKEGRQAFVVAPLIEPSEAEAMQEIVSASQMVEDLRALLPEACRIELLHGRMPAAQKDETMARFRDGAFDVLVSTTVIEVGVDVPNATAMVIENAERFGLSQLHQLRGRVGRGKHPGRCVLVAGDRSRKTQRRLEVVVKHTDGFLIAEKDLELRGPGELRGTRQSGVPELQLGDLASDVEIIERARDLAMRMLEADPELEAEWAARLREELARRSRAVGFRQII